MEMAMAIQLVQTSFEDLPSPVLSCIHQSLLPDMSLPIQGLSDLLVRRQAHKEAFNFRLSCKAANSSLVPQRSQLLLGSHADDEGDADLQEVPRQQTLHRVP